MSTAVPVRFRCFRCGRLLGVSRSKVGAVVACPQCEAELIVPDPNECEAELIVPDPNEGAEPASPPPLFEVPPELPSSRPTTSASRVEPVVVPWDAAPDSESSSVSVPGMPLVQVEPVSLRPDPIARHRGATRSRPGVGPDSDPPISLPTVALEEPTIREAAGIAPIGSRSALRESSPRRDDVILPRAAFLLWSFAALVALVLAFVAGLMIGRFLWAPRAAAAAGHAALDRIPPPFVSSGQQGDCIIARSEV